MEMDNMAAKTKYGKRILTKKLVRDIPDYAGKSLLAHDGELDEDCSLGYHCVSRPISFDEPHSHDFPEMLCFIGGNPLDITDFGAEIEFTIGGETHLINKPAVVSIPSGVTHCPVKIKKVSKPIIFLEISLTRIWNSSKSPPAGKKTSPKKTSGKA
jgi:hypothetical protein